MARTTRSRASAPAKSSSAEQLPPTNGSTSTRELQPPTHNPPKIFILPSAATSDARIASLLCPRTAKPARYLVCPESGIYEFTRIAAPKSTPRSWLIESAQAASGPATTIQQNGQDDTPAYTACVTKDADLYIATPIDPIFLVLAAVAASPSTTAALKSDGKKLFLSGDDHFDSIAELSPHLSEILQWGDGRIQKIFESRMAAVCDTVEAGDESMYRFSEDKLLAELLGKARSMAAQALPKSMEEKFVTKALEAPMVGVKVRETASEDKDAESQSTPKLADAEESQSSIASTHTAVSLVSEVSMTSTTATPVVDEEVTVTTTITADLPATVQASPEIIALQRLRVAFSYLCSAYLAPPRAASLKALLSSKTKDAESLAVDFEPLDAYLAQIAKMREDAAAARSIGDYSRKRVLDDDEAAERAEKKRLKEEEDRRKKAGESRGVKNLKKVNTTGMKKMSDFFKKA